MGVLKDCFLNSSLHGLHFIANSRLHWTERVFWGICVLASWAASLALMFSAIQQYQTQKISFSVDTSYLHWKTNFPSIVICEKKNSKVRSLRSKIRPDLEKLVFFDGSLSPQDKSACTESGKFRQQCLLGNYSDYMHKFRSKCSEIIGFCYYNDEDFSCCEEFLPVQTYHGPCFAFNSLVSGGTISTRDDLHFKITRDPDYGYGNLSIELFHAEVFVYALSQDAVPTKDTASKLALLETSKKSLRKGFQYNCFLSAMETSTDDVTRLMSVENRGCRFYDENILRYSSVYSMSACENECRANAQMKVCGCIVHTLPHNDEKDCDFDGIVCIVDNDKTISQIVKTCSCFSSCFDMEINNIGYTINAQNQQSENAKKEVRINFIVSPPYLHFTRKVVKTPLSMLVSIGGTVGLFIGASLLTVVEIIYYFIVRPLGNRYLNSKQKKMLKKYKQRDKDLFNCKRTGHFEFVN